MKKIAVFIVLCSALLLTSCHRPQEFYNASLSEYHFGSNSNEISTKAVLGTIYDLWDGDYAYKGLTADVSDVKAIVRFNESVASILLHGYELKPYFSENDYFIYTLKRTTENEVLLLQKKFYIGNDGNLTAETIYDFSE